MVDVRSFTDLGHDDVAPRIDGDIDHDPPLFLNGISRSGQASRTDGTAVQVEGTDTAHSFVCSAVGVAEWATLIAATTGRIALTTALAASG